jgi:hypothetical protein
MKRLDDSIDPEITASLDAIDATLAGEPVDPKYAELAELALLLSADRPQCSDEWAREMDARVARKFQAPPAHTSAEAGAAGSGSGGRRSRRAWLWTPAWAGGALAAAIAVVVVLSSGGSSGPPGGSAAGTPNAIARLAAPSSQQTSTASATTASSASSAPGSGVAGTAHGGAAGAAHGGTPGRTATGTSAPGVPLTSKTASPNTAAAVPPTFGGASNAAQAPSPQPNGRKIVQSAELYLTTRPVRVDQVAQEVFNVVGDQNGYVKQSSVTATNGPGAYAQFTLSVPSQNLQQTMTDLSRLRYASVASRTDSTQDVNNQYNNDVRQLNDAKALRTALLKQLASAVTQTQIDSLKAQIHDADQQISADQSTLNSLNRSVDYSQIQVTINGAYAPGPVAQHHHTSGFTLGKAAHDAGRVLTVAAGVALIALAAFVPIALVIALGWWITTAVQRRRRDHALDMA